jgi:DNA repair protein RadC
LRPVSPSNAGHWSGELISEFGSLAGTLAANRRAQQRVLNNRPAVDQLQAIRSAMGHVLRLSVIKEPIISTSAALLNYLRFELALAPAEQLRVLYLDAGNTLLRDLVMARGSVSEVHVSPREIVRQALDIGATALILIHNHPSGDPTPSAEDIAVTRRVASAAAVFDVQVHDHVIIARNGWSSLAALGLLEAAQAA